MTSYDRGSQFTDLLITRPTGSQCDLSGGYIAKRRVAKHLKIIVLANHSPSDYISIRIPEVILHSFNKSFMRLVNVVIKETEFLPHR